MDKAATEEKKRKAAALTGVADNRKRPSSAPGEPATESKRPKLDSEGIPSTSASLLSSFDFTSLPAPLITDLIVANLEAFSEPTLIALVQAYRQSHGLIPSISETTPVAAVTATSQPLSQAAPSSSTAIPPTGPRRAAVAALTERFSTPPQLPASETVKDEPVDPLQMDIDQDELEYEPERLNETVRAEILFLLFFFSYLAISQLSGDAPMADDDIAMGGLDQEAINIQLVDFKLPSPIELSEGDRLSLIGSSISRIWTGSEELKAMGESIPVDSAQAGGNSATEMWMLLLVRMITRVAEPPMDSDDELGENVGDIVHDFYTRQDQLRQTLCDYIMADFPSRQVLCLDYQIKLLIGF